MGTPAISLAEARRRIASVEDALRKGYRPPGESGNGIAALTVASDGVGKQLRAGDFVAIKKLHGIEPDWSLWNRAGPKAASVVSVPEFPDDDIPTKEIIEVLTKRYKKRETHHASKSWFPVTVRNDRPLGLAFIGDPHLDDNGCNWPLLRRDIDLMQKDGVYACNIGDTTNSWGGRLVHLWMNQDTSHKTARKLAKWFLVESGVRWLVWLLGNHDTMMGDAGSILKEMGSHLVPMEDWQARFILRFAGGRECRIWAAHQFPGHSLWNTLHGPQRAAHTKAEAHIYAAGHTHNWAVHQEESASRDFTYWLVRSRGYKFLDDYAEKLGHFSQDDGATVLAVIDPKATSEAGFVQCFADLEKGVDFLTWLRKRK